jgi:hypothetical protein
LPSILGVETGDNREPPQAYLRGTKASGERIEISSSSLQRSHTGRQKPLVEFGGCLRDPRLSEQFFTLWAGRQWARALSRLVGRSQKPFPERQNLFEPPAPDDPIDVHEALQTQDKGMRLKRYLRKSICHLPGLIPLAPDWARKP